MKQKPMKRLPAQQQGGDHRLALERFERKLADFDREIRSEFPELLAHLGRRGVRRYTSGLFRDSGQAGRPRLKRIDLAVELYKEAGGWKPHIYFRCIPNLATMPQLEGNRARHALRESARHRENKERKRAQSAEDS